MANGTVASLEGTTPEQRTQALERAQNQLFGSEAQAREDATRQGILGQSQKSFENFFAGQADQERAALDKFSQAISGQEAPLDVFSRLREESGLPELEGQLSTFRGEIGRVEDLLDRLDEDINERTEGTLTTEAQRRRQIAAESDPLTKNLARLGTAEGRLLQAIGGKEDLIGTQLGLIQAGQQKELMPFQMEISMLSDRLARETTGFTTQQQTELDLLVNKLSRQQQLADQEWDRLNQLAQVERDYDFQREESERSFQQQLELDSRSGSGQSAEIFQSIMDQINQLRESQGQQPNQQDLEVLPPDEGVLQPTSGLDMQQKLNRIFYGTGGSIA